MNVAQSLVRVLEEDEGVSRVYGLIGTSILEFVDALKDSKIRYISTRHDQGAVNMAVGEAKLTGRPGVAVLHGGPGFLNGLTGIAVAYKDSIPLVVISGAVKRRLSGLDSWLEVPQQEIVRPIVKCAYRINRSSEASSTFKQAFNLAATPPFGPVFVEVPVDVWTLECGLVEQQLQIESGPDSNVEKKKKRTDLDLSVIAKTSELLAHSSRPVILAGGGINNQAGSELLTKFAEKTKIPVVTTGNGRGAFPEDHPLSLGRCGFGGGNTTADAAIEKCDFLLAIGAGISDVTSYGYNYLPHGEIVLVTLDDSTERRPIPYSLLVKADASKFLHSLSELGMRYEPSKDWIEFLNEKREMWNSVLSESISKRSDSGQSHFVNPARFFTSLNSVLPRDAIISAGQGLHVLYAHSYLKVRSSSSFLAATNLGAMGYAFPAALGAKASFPEREVIAVLGDGEFLMSLPDLETATREGISVKIIVVNDNSYRVLLMRQKIEKMGRIFGTIHTNPDFEKLGAAYGFPAFVLDNDLMISAAIEFVFSKSDGNKPRLVELKISPEDLPPFNVEGSLKF